MENTVDLTVTVRASTIDAIKDYATSKGKDQKEVLAYISQNISNLIEASLKENTQTFALRASAMQKLNAYAHLRGSSKEEVAVEISDTLSETLEAILKERIAGELGLSTEATPAAPARSRKRIPPVQTYEDTTGITDGLGDEDPDPEMPPAEEDETALLPAQGGLTDKDLEEDMEIDDPEIEAKGDASTFGETLAKANGTQDGENLFAEVAGFDKDYVDPRIAKRKKGPSKSRGKVKALTESVESEGAGT